MKVEKNIALVAHDNRKHDLIAWVEWNVHLLLNIPIACNRSTADFMISSPLMEQEYDPILKDYEEYLQRDLP